ncbi:sensor histidine kinase [Nocardiopsis aegyptia]|uniref:sensor histidine kinase n=1 Tax=Nocardiopsis aegyptia TaxID=220378 RepID=UPI00366FA850
MSARPTRRDLLVLAGFVALAAVSCLAPLGAESPLPGPTVAMAVPALLAGWSPTVGRSAGVCVAAAFLAHPVVEFAVSQSTTPALAKGALAVFFAVLPWLVGRYLRLRSSAAGLGWRRAELLEREREVAVARERARERERIATRMHDSLGHDLSLLAVRAGALEVAEGLDTDDYRRGAAELGAGAIDAVERLQEIIGVLRGETGSETHGGTSGETGDWTGGETGARRGAGAGAGPGSEPVPGTEDGDGDLTALVGRARDAAVPVDLRGAAVWEELAPAGRALVYATVREALTNAAKHAPGAPVTVRLSRRPEGRPGHGAEVVNGPPTADRVQASGGRGLDSLRARVLGAGGTFEAGPRADGGFAVAVRLPEEPAARAPGVAPGSGSESAHQRTASGRRVRGALAASVIVPVALLAALALVWGGYYAYVSARSVLAPDVYASLAAGDPEDEVAAVLPPSTMLDPPGAGTLPDGWRCLYYRSETAWPGARTDAYRLCFAGGRLVDQATVPLGAGEGER